MKTIRLQAETVGLAFQQQLGMTYAIKKKTTRKVEFNRMAKVLSAMRLVESNFDIETIAWGVDKNGDEAILVTGQNRKSKATVPSAACP